MQKDSNSRAAADNRATWAAMAACLVMMAFYVGSKAVRDALFLSHFPVTSLPAMVIAASLLSIAAVLGAAKLMNRLTPARVVPVAFAASAALLLGTWLAMDHFPRLCSVLVYLQSVVIGSILTSGYWSMVNERFDPRTAKQLIGRIAGAGTLGGMIGGFVAERIAAYWSQSLLLPVLAVYQIACAVLLRQTGAAQGGPRPAANDEDPSGWQLVKSASYLKTLAALVLLGTFSAAMLDYVFKAAALAHYGRGETLLRFFALFYSVSGVATFLVQAGLSSLLLSQLDTARTLGTLPLAVTLGSLAAMLIPGLHSATGARALELVFRGSLFRAAYEVFYAPMPVRDKRAAKAAIDVGFDRMGDALGSVMVSLLLLLGPTISTPAILTAAVVVALTGLYVASRVEDAYITALEHGLRDRGAAVQDDSSEVLSLGGFTESLTMIDASAVIAQATNTPTTPPASDPIVEEIAALRSGSTNSIRRVIARGEAVNRQSIPHLIALLANDGLGQEAMGLLRNLASRHAGQLLDALLDSDTDLVIRRRIPRILSAVPTQLVADGLLQALNDRRFEVRYQCGRALAAITERNRLLRFSSDQIFGFIQREVAVSKPVWDGHRLLERNETGESDALFDEVLRDRTNKGLQHLFTLLSLVLPGDSLRIAFNGLHANDPYLRGTALEYLASVLPPDIRHRLWPLIEAPEVQASDARPQSEIMQELIRTDQSIVFQLEEIRRKAGPPKP